MYSCKGCSKEYEQPPSFNKCEQCGDEVVYVENHARQTKNRSSPDLNVGKADVESGSNPDSPLLKDQPKKSVDGETEVTDRFPRGTESADSKGTGSESLPSSPFKMKCEICNENELGTYCTANTCRDCCEKGLCPWDSKCVNDFKRAKDGRENVS